MSWPSAHMGLFVGFRFTLSCCVQCVRLSRQKASLEESAGNSSEDLVANDLSDNDMVDDDDDDDDERDRED